MPDAIDGRDIITRLLRDAGVPEDVVGQAGDPTLDEHALVEIEDLARELPKEDVGGTRVLIAGRHFSLGEAGWKLLTSVAALAISTLDPTGLTKVIALKEGLDLFKQLRPLLKKLDPAKALVCSAIAAISAEKKRQSLAERGASKDEIVSYFHQRNEISPIALDDILKSLQADKVLESTYYRSVGPFFSIKF